jgi:hypothetical protein
MGILLTQSAPAQHCPFFWTISLASWIVFPAVTMEGILLLLWFWSWLLPGGCQMMMMGLQWGPVEGLQLRSICSFCFCSVGNFDRFGRFDQGSAYAPVLFLRVRVLGFRVSAPPVILTTGERCYCVLLPLVWTISFVLFGSCVLLLVWLSRGVVVG